MPENHLFGKYFMIGALDFQLIAPHTCFSLNIIAKLFFFSFSTFSLFFPPAELYDFSKNYKYFPPIHTQIFELKSQIFRIPEIAGRGGFVPKLRAQKQFKFFEVDQ